jgi:hypothetical protein
MNGKGAKVLWDLGSAWRGSGPDIAINDDELAIEELKISNPKYLSNQCFQTPFTVQIFKIVLNSSNQVFSCLACANDWTKNKRDNAYLPFQPQNVPHPSKTRNAHITHRQINVAATQTSSLKMAPLTLSTLSEKSLHQPADANLIAYCPSMDLIALTTTDQQVLIYRLNGQRVYGAAQKAGVLKVESVRWKPNGSFPVFLTLCGQACRKMIFIDRIKANY